MQIFEITVTSGSLDLLEFCNITQRRDVSSSQNIQLPAGWIEIVLQYEPLAASSMQDTQSVYFPRELKHVDQRQLPVSVDDTVCRFGFACLSVVR